MATVTTAMVAGSATGAGVDWSVSGADSAVRDVGPAVRRVRPAGDAGHVDEGRRQRRISPGRPAPIACDRSYEGDLHGSRLTRRGKVVVSAVWLVFAAAIVFMVSRPAEVPVPSETTVVRVESGATLWGVAGEVAPGVDPRVTVDQIVELNGLRSAGDVYPGDVLVVPLVSEGG